MKTDPQVCARCAARGKTCCELSGGDEEFCFPLSDTERDALLAGGIAAEAFVEAENSAGFVEQLDLLMPHRGVRQAFPRTGSHWRLATLDGRCYFLGANGCSLSQDTRPIYCKLFPLWLIHGQLTWFTAEECLANEECESVTEMLVAMGTDAAAIRKLFAEMCTALRLKAPKVLS